MYRKERGTQIKSLCYITRNQVADSVLTIPYSEIEDLMQPLLNVQQRDV